MHYPFRILVLMAGLLLPIISQGANWVKFPISSIEGSAYFMDTSSLEKHGHYVRIWERLVLNKPSENPALGAFQSSTFHMSYDCGHKAAALLETRFYKDPDSQNQVANHIRAKPRYLYVAPDTPSAMKLDEACKLAQEHRPRSAHR